MSTAACRRDVSRWAASPQRCPAALQVAAAGRWLVLVFHGVQDTKGGSVNPTLNATGIS